MLRKVAVGVAAAVLVLVTVVALQPAEFRIERTAEIAAPPGVVFSHVQSLRAWEAWSPWARMDPEMKNTYSGPAAGVGASTAWTGPKAGEGRMTITSVEPERVVEIRLEFVAPMQATNRALFTFAPNGDATQVTWRMDGRNGFVGKAFGLFVDVEGMVGADFERGLASLAAVAEADAARP